MSALLFFFTVIIGFSVFYSMAVKRLFDAPFLFTLHGITLMGIPPLLHAFGYSLDYSLINEIDTGSANLLLSAVLAVFIIGLYFGYLAFRKAPIGRFLLPNYNYDRSRIMTLTGIMALTIFGFLVILFPLVSVNFHIIEAVSEIRHGGFFFGGLNFLRQFLFFGSMLSGAFLISLLRDKKDGRRISKSFIRTVFLLFVFNITMSVLLGGKAFVIFPLGATILGYELCVRQKGYRRIIFALCVLGVLIVSLQNFRTEIVANKERSTFDNVYTGLYFIVYDTTLFYVKTDNERHFTKTGEDFKNGLILLIPRILWSDKPEAQLTAGNRFAQQISPEKDNPGGKPPYGFAQWYVNFGWIGVFIGGMLTGWLLALLQTQYKDFPQNPFHFFIMWHFVFFVLGPWPGGVHNTSLLNYALYIFPLFIFKWLSKSSLYKTRKL